MRVLAVRRALFAASCSVLAVVVTTSPAAHPRISTTLTWAADIHPILERRCASCHKQGGIAPMSFESYESARPWARAIREEVLERRMPPTAIRSGSGLFENARSLSLGEMELLAAWVDGGAPNGTEPWLVAEGGGASPKPAPAKAAVPMIAWDVTLDGKAVLPPASPLTHRVQFSAPAGWLGAWMLDAGGLPARSALLSVGNDAPFGSWAPDEAPVQYPDQMGVRFERPTTVTVDFTLTAAADDAERSAARPTLKLVTRTNARQRVMATRIRDAAAPLTAGDLLLAIRLGLENPDATADVIVTRQNGDQVFLMAMAPPGIPDANTYRLRAPMAIAAGDTIRVETSAPFVLDVETARADKNQTRQK